MRGGGGIAVRMPLRAYLSALLEYSEPQDVFASSGGGALDVFCFARHDLSSSPSMLYCCGLGYGTESGDG